MPSALLDDLDEVVVERLCAGQRVPATREERREAVRRLRRRGYTYAQIADAVGSYQRQVHRDLVRMGLLERQGGVAPEDRRRDPRPRFERRKPSCGGRDCKVCRARERRWRRLQQSTRPGRWSAA